MVSSKKHWFHIYAFNFSIYISLYFQRIVRAEKLCLEKETLSLLSTKWRSAWTCSESNTQSSVILQVQSAYKMYLMYWVYLYICRVCYLCFIPTFSSSLMSRVLNVLLQKCRLLLLWEDNYENKIWNYKKKDYVLVLRKYSLKYLGKGFITSVTYPQK